MPKYRLKPGHKHYHLGQRYEGPPIGKKGEFPDVLELDEDRAERIMNKLIPLDGKPVEKPEEKGPETESSVPAEADDSEQASDKVDEDSDSPSESESIDPAKSVEDSSPLSLKYVGDSKWNVMRGDKPINDAPLTEEEAKALVEGSKE